MGGSALHPPEPCREPEPHAPGLAALFVAAGLGCVALIGYRWADQTRRQRPAEPEAVRPTPPDAPQQSKRREIIECPRTSVYAVALAPDGKRVFVAGAALDQKQRDQPVVRVWDVNEGGETAALRIDGEVGRYVSVALSPDGKSVAAGGLIVVGEKTIGNVCVWDLEAEAPLWSASMTHPVQCVAWSADGSLLAAGDGGEEVAVWDAAGADAGVAPPPLTGKPSAVTALAWSHAGKRLAIGTTRGARVWDAADRREVAATAPPNNLFTALAFAPDDRSVYVAGRIACDVWVWDLETNSETTRLNPQLSPVLGLALGPGTRWYATLTRGQVRSNDPGFAIRGRDASGRELWRVSARTDDPQIGHARFALTPDGRHLAFAALRRDADAALWRVELYDIPPQE